MNVPLKTGGNSVKANVREKQGQGKVIFCEGYRAAVVILWSQLLGAWKWGRVEMRLVTPERDCCSYLQGAEKGCEETVGV